MARKVVCKICRAKGDSDSFFKVSDEQGKSKYYCNKMEYETFINEKEKRDDVLKYIAIDVFNYDEGQFIPPVLIKKLNELHSFYDYEVIQECFKDNKDNIHYWIGAKNFTNEYNMVSYVMKIIEGSINDTYAKWKFKKKQETKQENTSVDLDIMNQLDNEKEKNSTKNNGGILAFLDEEDI